MSELLNDESIHTLDLDALTPEQIAAIEYETDIILDFQQIIDLHAIQEQIVAAIIHGGKRLVFIECGRKFGKTETVTYILHRVLSSIPNAAGYYIAPFQKQAKELIWANNRVQNFFMPKKDPATGKLIGGVSHKEAQAIFERLKKKYYKGDPNNTEMRQRYNNDSFHKLDGSDQYEAYRGVNPHVICYDEFKDFHPKFHEGMDPNLATYNAILVVVGTPPSGGDSNEQGFYDLAEEAKIREDGLYINVSSYANPHISKEWLDKKRDSLIATGRETTWLREYMAKRVKDGSSSIFPMLELPSKSVPHTKHVRPHAEILDKLRKHRKDWEYLQIFDPGSVSCHATLYFAVNKYTKELLIIDETYETRKGEMGTKKIWEKGQKMIQDSSQLSDRVRKVYDNAAAWFAQEVSDQFQEGMEKCTKDTNNIEAKLNLIKEALAYGYMKISDRCVKLLWEMENYRTDDKGKLPTENDHLIDCLRYGLSACYYSIVEGKFFDDRLLGEDRRAISMEDDFDRMKASALGHVLEGIDDDF